VNRGELQRDAAEALIEDYRQRLTQYTYLD
jgi:hypothetical protein